MFLMLFSFFPCVIKEKLEYSLSVHWLLPLIYYVWSGRHSWLNSAITLNENPINFSVQYCIKICRSLGTASPTFIQLTSLALTLLRRPSGLAHRHDTHTHTHTRVRASTRAHTHTHTSTLTHMHTHMHTHNAHTQTHKHTHTHAQLHACHIWHTRAHGAQTQVRPRINTHGQTISKTTPVNLVRD